MSDYTDYKEIIDNTWEHSQHIIYDNNCSECYKNPPQVKVEDGYIMLDNNYEIKN